MTGLVVNGRFLRSRPTGLARTARSLLAAGREGGLDCTVLAPPGIDDPLADRVVGATLSRTSDQIWEQTALPIAARQKVLLSLTNTAPLAHPHNVIWVHDLAPLVGPQWFAGSMAAYGRLVLTAARRADRVLTVSEQIAEELRSRSVTAPITVLRSAVDAAFGPATDGQRTALRSSLGLDKPFLLFVGWADPRKDVITAIAAHVRAAQSIDHDLVLVGLPHPVFAPVEVPALPTVRRLDFVSDQQLRTLLSEAAALVYPSRYEGFGLPPLEAWACGSPALVSDIPAIREATQSRATYLTPGDIDDWATAMVAAISGEIPTPTPAAWTWADTAEQLRKALD